MGSPDYAIPTLESLYGVASSRLLGVVTQPSRPKGRGLNLQSTPVYDWAIQHHIPVWTPATKDALADLVMANMPTLVVVIAYGMILPKQIVDSFMCVNLHGSLLPAYRGASPVQAALLNGDSHTGVTLIHMNDRMDQGPVLAIKKVPILPSDCFGTLFHTLSHMSASLCVDFLDNATACDFQARPQVEGEATYCKKLSGLDFELNPSEDSPELMWRKIRAFSPKPGAFLIQNGRRIKILEASLSQDRLVPICIQPEGKKPMTYDQYLRGQSQAIEL